MRIISNFRKDFLNPENYYLQRLLEIWVRIADFPQWCVDFPQEEVKFG
jgi:hypothetical protein